ncbi:ferritin-like domain-containing protein [uncultured Mycobacterium sp.]|uniref:ferritin-like domain-containing protein n=1 Tax=uncultured Mycobacterium sp. TaxID=171292 RepID=UPI0035CC4389
MTSAEPTQTTSTSARPSDPEDAALCDALVIEHSVVYGYGIVSAHSTPDLNAMVSEALNQHRRRRDAVIAMLAARSVTGPVAAAGYQLPFPVNNATDAARLAVRMENDAAVAWRAAVEQAKAPDRRSFAITALTQSAVMAARWNRVLGAWPMTKAFPGGTE